MSSSLLSTPGLGLPQRQGSPVGGCEYLSADHAGPIETGEGWLLFYHGVLRSRNGFVYSRGAALLDQEQPWKVIARSSSHLLAPETDYEHKGDVPNVVFPCA